MSREHDRAASLLTDRIDELEKREEELLADIREKEARIEELRRENEQLQHDFEAASLKFQETEAINTALQDLIESKTGK